MRTRTVIESPYAGANAPAIAANVAYLDRCYLDSLSRGEAPIASHGSRLVHVLNDSKPDERAIGLEAGTAWIPVADLVVFYVDRGMSNGMVAALELCLQLGKSVEFRRLDVKQAEETPEETPEPTEDPPPPVHVHHVERVEVGRVAGAPKPPSLPPSADDEAHAALAYRAGRGS